MKEIRFTQHSQEKIEILATHGLEITALSALWGKLYLNLHFFPYSMNAFCLLPFAYNQ